MYSICIPEVTVYSLPPLPLLTLDYPGASQRLFSVYPIIHIPDIYISEVTVYSLSPPSSSTCLVYPGASQRLFTPIITAMDSTVRQTRRELVESAAFP